MKAIEKQKNIFEAIKKTNDEGIEYWSARELGKVLDYNDYRNFQKVIEKSKIACSNSHNDIEDHFVDVTEMVQIGSGAQRTISTVWLSRYACYLIVQNADPQKEIVALGQTYFAYQTRKQEIEESEEYNSLETEDKKRLYLRNQLKKHNIQLMSAAKNAGVETNLDYGIFQNHGYKGLYGGLDQKAIHKLKGLKKSQKILDHMGSTELAANLFRATQTEEKLKKDNIKDKRLANKTHYNVGKEVRNTIKKIGGEMPENMPTEDSIKKIERKEAKELKSKKS